MAKRTFVSDGPISRPSNNNQRLIEHRKCGGISFDVRWGLFIPFSDELVAYQEPHPAEVGTVGTSDFSDEGAA